MNSYQEGRKAATDNQFRAAPEQYKILTAEWREWYKGYDSTGLIPVRVRS